MARAGELSSVGGSGGAFINFTQEENAIIDRINAPDIRLLSSLFGEKPERISFTYVDLLTDVDQMEFLNPSGFKESFGANYAEQNIRGLSHRLLQYDSTENYKLDLELFCEADSDTDKQINSIRRFFAAATHPRKGAGTIPKVAPPRLLFMWPKMLTLTCVVRGVSFDHRIFFRNGQTRIMTVNLSLTEIRDVIVYAEDILADKNGYGRRGR